MYKLMITEFADQDLEGIVLYIAVQLENPAAASELLNEVDTCYEYLKSNPKMYSTCNDIRLKKEGYRKAVIKNYLFIYKVNEITKTVYGLRFFYGAQNYEKLL